MSRIVGFKMGKGATVEGKDKKTWKRRYLELEFTCPERFTEESLVEAFARAENIIDHYLGQMGQPGEVQVEAAQIPELDLEAIKSLPWKGKAKEPSSPGAWGWVYGPTARMGIEKGAEKLAEAIEKAADHKLQLGDMEYFFTKDKAFINRQPVKQESAK